MLRILLGREGASQVSNKIIENTSKILSARLASEVLSSTSPVTYELAKAKIDAEATKESAEITAKAARESAEVNSKSIWRASWVRGVATIGAVGAGTYVTNSIIQDKSDGLKKANKNLTARTEDLERGEVRLERELIRLDMREKHIAKIKNLAEKYIPSDKLQEYQAKRKELDEEVKDKLLLVSETQNNNADENSSVKERDFGTT